MLPLQRARRLCNSQILKLSDHKAQVTAIRLYNDTFEVTTADGRRTAYQEANLRFKIDTSDLGPLAGKPVILPGGARGDRATVFFASLSEIGMLDTGALTANKSQD